MSSIRNMIRQAAPEADPEPARPAPAARPAGESSGSRRPLNLPAAEAPEDRKPWSTRLRPSLKAELEALVKEIRGSGWPVTQELVIDALLQELGEDDGLRERVAARAVKMTR